MIGILNTRGDMRDALASHFEICNLDGQPFDLENCPELGGLFIDWLPNLDEKLFLKQVTILQEYVKKGIPVVLFDRHSMIDQQQYRWLSKFNVTFMEPRVRFRTGFEWCPQWVTPLPDDWWTGNKEERKIKLAYKGSLAAKIKSFEKYYKTYAQIFPTKTTVYKCTDLDLWKGAGQENKKREWQESNLVPQNTLEPGFNFADVDMTIVIGSYKDYASGYLPDNLFDIMKMGVIPLLPSEHRFFWSMFDGLIVKDEKDIDYAISFMPKVREVIIQEIFDNLYPEFKLEYAVEKIKQCLMI